MTSYTTYTTEQIEAIAAKLREMPPVERKKPAYNKKEAVTILTQEIMDLRTRGYSLEQIAASLRGEGLDITTPTLKNYLKRATTPAEKQQPTGNQTAIKKATRRARRRE